MSQPSSTMAEEDLLPARMLNEWVYCPRLFYLMQVQKLFVHSADTVEGRAQHARARARASQPLALEPPWAGARLAEFTLSAPDEGIVARLDALVEDAGSLIPVEAKHGAAPVTVEHVDVCGSRLSGEAWPTDQIQVGAQAMVLRAHGHRCEQAHIFYRASRSTVRVEVDAQLVAAVRAVVVAARQTALGPLPPPLVDSPKCIGCSLNSVCLPDETNLLLQRSAADPRHVVAARADGGGIYVVSQGARVGKTSESLTIAVRGQPEEEVPLKDCEHLAVFGGVQVSSQAVSMLVEAGRSIVWHSQSGRCLARAAGVGTPNLVSRREQFRLADDPDRCLAVARPLVAAKIHNQRVLLRRNAEHPSAAVLETLAHLGERALSVSDATTLLGVEGEAAHVYFGGLADLLGGDDKGPWMSGRSRRPPRDPANAVLSFAYALLLSECIAAVVRVGLDPDLGFHHVAIPGRPALALDLMEPFRPLIVDSLTLRLFHTKRLSRDDFVNLDGSVRMQERARREVIEAFEQRMHELVTHPKFAYRMSYRRILEVEVRLLARHLEGELPAWRPLTTR